MAAQVDAGTALTEQASRATEEIAAAVKRVVGIMSEISAASQEQGKGIEQVNVAIGQMDEMTQQNAALVEQAAAAESLHAQAEECPGRLPPSSFVRNLRVPDHSFTVRRFPLWHNPTARRILQSSMILPHDARAPLREVSFP